MNFSVLPQGTLISELEVESFMTSFLREKLCSKELEVEQCRAELATAVRNTDIVKYEVQNAKDNLSCAAHKLKGPGTYLTKKKKGPGTSGVPYSLKTTCVNDKHVAFIAIWSLRAYVCHSRAFGLLPERLRHGNPAKKTKIDAEEG